MKPKGTSRKDAVSDVRYIPIDQDRYPETAEDNGVVFSRFWCRPGFIVYEKSKNGIRLGYLVFPGEIEIYPFSSMVAHCEGLREKVVLCHPENDRSTRVKEMGKSSYEK